MATLYGPELGLSEVVVLLLGEKQSGKSSAGNIILGRQAFDKKTSRSSKKSGTNLGIQVTVVDTPGWSSNSTTPGRVSQELHRGLTLCGSEPHVVLLVLPISATFGAEQWRAMESQLTLLQTTIFQRAMVLFTHGELLGHLRIQEYIRRQGQTLQWLLERCGNRYLVFTNQPGTSGAQAMEFFKKTQMMVETKKHLRELQYSLYTPPRRDVAMREDRRRPIQREETQMTVMHNVHDGRLRPSKQRSSGLQYTPAASFPARSAGLGPALSLVLLGRRKSGKSSAGNMILGREEFQPDAKTTKSSAGHGMVSRWPVTVVDTPGWSLFGLANPEQVRREISLSPSLCPMRSKVTFLLALPVDTFGERDRKAVEKYLSVLGSEVWRSTVVLFTYGAELRGRTVEKHVEKMGKSLQQVLDRCNRRYHVIDTNTGDETQVKKLLELVEKL